MPRRHRRTLIFGPVILVTILTLFTPYAPVGAWGGSTDIRSRAELSEVLLEGKTFRVLVSSTCPSGGTRPDTWEFREGGQLVGETISNAEWSQRERRPGLWEAYAIFQCAGFYLHGHSLGSVIVGSAFDPIFFQYMIVVGILE